MNREDVKKLLGEGATEAQVTAVLDKFHEEQNTLKTQVSNLEGQVSTLRTENSDLTGYKTKWEESEKEKLSKEEKLELDRKELAEKLKATSKLQNSIKAKSILIGAGISEEEAEKLVASIVKEDETETLNSANLLATQFNSIKENTAKQTREELANLNVKPNPSNIPPNSNEMTWEKFSNLPQAEQNKFIKENPEAFSKL